MSVMPWWSWLVIWVVLVLALVGMFAWLGYRIVIKVIGVFRALGELAGKAEILQARAEEFGAEPSGSAVFADLAALRIERLRMLEDRRYIRQQRTEARVKRGKLLVRADPRQFAHLLKRM